VGAHVHGGRLVADALAAEGIDALFTLTGGHISPIFDGCKDVGVRVIDVRHEQAAAHAADAYGRLTFRPGVAAVTAGPGVTDAITGVTNAYYANAPMVLLGGRNPLGLERIGALQDAPQVELLRPVTKRADTALETRRLREVLGYAFREALHAADGADLRRPADGRAHDPGRQRPGRRRPSATGSPTDPAPDPDAVARAAACSRAPSTRSCCPGPGPTGRRRGKSSMSSPRSRAAGVRQRHVPGHPALRSSAPVRADPQARAAAGRRRARAGVDFDFRLGYGRPPAYRDDVRVIHVDPRPTRSGTTAGRPRRRQRHPRLPAGTARARGHPRARGVPVARRPACRRGPAGEARDAAATSDSSPVNPLRFARRGRAVGRSRRDRDR
jgi:acetolactate synthase I/II/III large subunit